MVKKKSHVSQVVNERGAADLAIPEKKATKASFKTSPSELDLHQLRIVMMTPQSLHKPI